MAKTREFDIVVYGATGFTGRLVAEYLAQNDADGSVKWAMAGRSAEKLASVRDLIGAPADTPLITADAADPAALKTMVESTKVVLTTVGPYGLYGEPLVAACAAAGTDYVDLCGEVPFMRQMIDAHGETAKKQARASSSPAVLTPCLSIWASISFKNLPKKNLANRPPA